MTSSFGLAFLAGIASILSPCVLPLAPIVLGAAAAEHRLAPSALAAGVAASFVVVGLFVATIGFAIGLDGDFLRRAAAFLMIAIGVLLAVPSFQTHLAAAGGPIGDWVEQRWGGFSTRGLTGQFGVGLLLGAVWSPCVGPTLGAASILAAQSRSLGSVAATMALFGVGAALPLALLGSVSRQVLMRWRGAMLTGGRFTKAAMGVAFALIGLSILVGLDKQIEALLVEASPDWLTALTTRF